MTKEEFAYLLKNPKMVQEHQVKNLEHLCDTYPYFQSAKAIYLKALKDKGSYQYNKYLKKTAVHTVDRWVLFDFITSPVFIKQHPQNVDKNQDFETLEVKDAEIVANITTIEDVKDGVSQQNIQSNDESRLQKDLGEKSFKHLEEEITQKPIPFKVNEKHSFAEWLQLTNIQPLPVEIVRDKREVSEIPVNLKEQVKSKDNEAKERKFALIDNFISKNPKIKPADKKNSSRNLAKDQGIPPEELMTETLARVFTAQHKYKKAIQAYKILILKNPEKSGFFADQIRAIQKLQETKS